MTNSLTGISTSLLAHPDINSDAVSALLSQNDATPAPITSVRLKAGTKALVDLLSMKLGISQSQLINLLIEGKLREIFLPFSRRADSIIERFEVLMNAHDLHLTDIAQLLSPWNVRLSVLKDRERTMDFLTTSLLTELANWFYVSPDWLLGHDVPPVETSKSIHLWPDNEVEFKSLFIPSAEKEIIEIIFWTNKNNPDNERNNKAGILIKKKIPATEVIYYPVLSIVRHRMNPEHKQWINGIISDDDRTYPMRSVIIPDSAATALEQGTTLPALILRQI